MIPVSPPFPSKPSPRLASTRVRLEPITPARAAALLDGRPEPQLPWAPGFPLAALRPALRMVVRAGADEAPLGPFFAYVIVRRSDGVAVGDAGFHGPPGADGDVEVGYALVPSAQGTGLATDAVRLLATWALAHPGVRTVTAFASPANLPSLRVLQRLGFVQDGERGTLLRFALAGPRPVAPK